jgi:hypothetical protein
MDTDKLLRDISLDLDTFQAHIKRMRKHKDVHRLDIDLLQEKTRVLYDNLISLEAASARPETLKSSHPINLPEQMPKGEIPEKTENKKDEPAGTIFPEPVVEAPVKEKKETQPKTKVTPPPAPKPEPSVEKKPEAPVSPETAVKEEKPAVMEESVKTEKVINEEKPAVKEEPVKAEPAVRPESAPEQPPAEHDKPQSAFDLFTSSVGETIGDKLGDGDSTSIADQMQKSSIADLKRAIGINEKFLFINELFSGDLGKYNRAIEEFNELQNKEGVRAHLVELKVQFQWDEDSDAYKKLEALLERKFG